MRATNDDCVYVREKNGRYRPFGMRFNENYLPDGIWYIRHNKYSSRTTNVDRYLSGLFKIGDVQEPINIPELCAKQEYVDYILASKEFADATEKGKKVFLYDLVSKLVALILEKNKELKEE